MSENQKQNEEQNKEKKEEVAKTQEETEEKIEGMKAFLSAHELQLYGMQFPHELEEKLFTKLKYEIFDAQHYFEIMDNQDENRYLLRSKTNIKKNEFVCLIDHCWTYKLRKFSYFCENFPNIIKRVTTMLKYATFRKPIINTLKKEPEQKRTQTLSIEDNKIENIFFIEDILEKNKQIKAFWCSGNTFCDVNEGYEADFENKFPNLEILNRKLTPNATEWACEFILNDSASDNINKLYYDEYDKLYGTKRILDLSDRDPFKVKDFGIFSKVKCCKILGVDISENEYDFSKDENKNKLIEFLNGFNDDLEYLYLDDNDDIFNTQEEQELNEYNIFMDKELLNKLSKKIKYINGLSINTILSRNDKYENLLQLKREKYVHQYMWAVNRTYRLVSEEKYDEDAIYYFNDEFGSSINHSDVPNCCLFPFIFSKKINLMTILLHILYYGLKKILKKEKKYSLII